MKKILVALLLCLAVSARAELFQWSLDIADESSLIESISIYYLVGGETPDTATTSTLLDSGIDPGSETSIMLWSGNAGTSYDTSGGFYIAVTTANADDVVSWTSGSAYASFASISDNYGGSLVRGDGSNVPTETYNFGTVTVTPVPEPATGALFLAGVAILAIRRKRS